MKISSWAKYAVGVTAAAAMLAACSAGGNSSFSPSSGIAPMGHETGVTPLSVQRVLALTMAQGIAHPSVSHHVIPNKGKGGGGKSALLYASDQDTNNVDIYNYPSGGLVGTATGGDGPYGQCVDKKGNVYVAEFDSGDVLEYAHGGTTPIQTFATNGYAIGCAVDKKGDLAVSDFYSFSGGQGSLEVFSKGNPNNGKSYQASGCYYMWPPGADKKGDFIVEGEYSRINVCALMKGSSSMTTLTMSGFSIDFPGGVQWDGKNIALTDQEYEGQYLTGIYQTKLSGSTLTSSGSTVLNDTCYNGYVDVVQPFIVGKKNTPVNNKLGTTVVGGNLWCVNAGNPDLPYWAYPAGGSPEGYFTPAPEYPAGQSVSIGKSS
jgi:hypothetical protein